MGKLRKIDGATRLDRLRLAVALLLGLAVSGVVVTSALAGETRLGAPVYWTWMLTGLQVLALWAAGSRRWWGWLLGGAVQLPWIAYAVVTGQFGFIPGCAISAMVQTYSFVRQSGRDDIDSLPRPQTFRPTEAAA